MAATARIREAEILLGEQRLPFTLYHVPRRRHVQVQVNENGDLEVRAPWRYSLAEAKLFNESEHMWAKISKQQATVFISQDSTCPGCAG